MGWTDGAGFGVWLTSQPISANTAGQYARACRRALRDVDLDRADTDELAAWMAATLPATAASRNQARKALVKWYEWRIATTARTTNPAAGLPALRQRQGVPRPARDPAGILMAAQQHSPMMGAFAGLLFYAALRFSEARLAQWPDLLDGWLEIAGKGGQRQNVPISEACAELLSRWGRQCPDPTWMFPSPHGGPLSESALRSRWRAISPDATPHQARHRAATDALELTGRLDVVQSFLRHASPQTTRVYALTRPDTVAAAAGQLHYG